MNGLLLRLRPLALTTMSKHNPYMVKVNRNYTFEELAAVLGVHKNTVAAWVKNGLPCLNERRPYLILGSHAREYLLNQRALKKQTCKPNELYCLRCKCPTTPAENFVEYTPITPTKGRLSGFCSSCECVINKFISPKKLARYEQVFDVSLPSGLEHIRDSDKPL